MTWTIEIGSKRAQERRIALEVKIIQKDRLTILSLLVPFVLVTAMEIGTGGSGALRCWEPGITTPRPQQGTRDEGTPQSGRYRTSLSHGIHGSLGASLSAGIHTWQLGWRTRGSVPGLPEDIRS